MRRAKKWLGVVSAFALTLALGFNTLAAPSPSADGAIKNEAVSAVDANGNKITAEISDNVDATVKADVQKKETLKAALGSAYAEGMEVVAVKEVKAEKLPATITFAVSGVTAGNGTITATFTELSPVAFVVDKSTVSGNTGKTSPKTGEASMATVAVVALVAVVAAVGLRKKEYVK